MLKSFDVPLFAALALTVSLDVNAKVHEFGSPGYDSAVSSPAATPPSSRFDHLANTFAMQSVGSSRDQSAWVPRPFNAANASSSTALAAAAPMPLHKANAMADVKPGTKPRAQPKDVADAFASWRAESKLVSWVFDFFPAPGSWVVHLAGIAFIVFMLRRVQRAV